MTCLNVFGPLLPDPLEPTMFRSMAGCSLRWMIHFQAKMHHAEMQQQHFLLSSNWISARAGLLRISLTVFFFQFFNIFVYGWSERIWFDVFHVDRPHWRRYCCYWLPNCSPSHPPFWCFACWQYSEFPNVVQAFYHFEEGTQTLAGHEHDVLTPFSREFTRRFNHVQTANHIILMLCTKKARQMSIIVLVLFSTWNQGRISFVAHLCGLVLLSWHHAGEAPWIGRSDVIAIGRLHQRKVGNLL